MAIGIDTQTPQQLDSATVLSSWLRDRYANTLALAHASVMSEAVARREHVGIIEDRRIRTILAQAQQDKSILSDATAKAYERDYHRLLTERKTPLEKATTFQHFNRLRSAFRFGEAQNIANLRRKAEAARKAKHFGEMRCLTTQAFERAVIFDAMFLEEDHPVWSQKSAALRATGQRPNSKSKRAAGRNAPSPDQLLVAIGNQRNRATRVEVFAACFALFGIRPAELVKGVELVIEGEGLRLIVSGAKFDATRGQKTRELEILPTSLGQSELTVKVLRANAAENGGLIKATETDIVAVRRALREVQPGLSPYAYRHARASDAKASHGREEVAAWLGHATDRTQSIYGNSRSKSGAVTIKSATASRAVRKTKTLPPTTSERLILALGRMQSRSPQSASSPITTHRQSIGRKGPR